VSGGPNELVGTGGVMTSLALLAPGPLKASGKLPLQLCAVESHDHAKVTVAPAATVAVVAPLTARDMAGLYTSLI
jgi:hypothetical protein